MLKITVTTFDSPCSIQDNYPPPGKVISFEPNDTKSFDVQWDQLERMGPQLDSLAGLGFLTYTVGGTDGMSLTEQADSPGNPILDYAEPGVGITAASQALVITGQKLLAGQVQAEATVEGDTAAGSVLLKATNPGAQGNRYDVEVVDSGGVGGLAVAVNVVAGRTVITIDLDGSAAETVATVVALINNVASATYGLVHATEVGVNTTPITATQALEAFTGGVGSGMQVTLASLACTVVSIDISADPIHQITLATPSLVALGLATGDALKLEVRSGGKLTDITLQHA